MTILLSTFVYISTELNRVQKVSVLHVLDIYIYIYVTLDKPQRHQIKYLN